MELKELNEKLLNSIKAFNGGEKTTDNALVIITASDGTQSNCVMSGICGNETIKESIAALLKKIYIEGVGNDSTNNLFQNLMLGMNLIISSSNPDFFKEVLVKVMNSDQQVKDQLRAIALLSDEELKSLNEQYLSKNEEEK